MELTCKHETICINEVVYDGVMEQSVELDHMLPDYCKNIFKILRCRLVPHITASRVQNGRLLVEGMCRIEILYTAEESFAVCSVTQKQSFSKTMELKDAPQSGQVTADVRCDYINCRAVSPRRIDVRGALLIRAIVTAPKEHPVLCSAQGMGIQTDAAPVTVLSKRLTAQQSFTVREEIPLAYGKPDIGEILSIDAAAVLTDTRIVANRAVTKGEISAHLLYLPQSGGQPEVMEHVLPLSQVLDIQGITEEYSLQIRFDVTDIETVMKQDENGACTAVSATFSITASCEADKNEETCFLRDAYSTCYDAKAVRVPVMTGKMVRPIRETRTCKATISIPQSELSAVYDLSCTFVSDDCRISEGQIHLTGSLCCCLLACDTENMPTSIEKKSPCEVTIDALCCEDGLFFHPCVSVSATSYRLASAEEVEVSVELLITGTLCCNTSYTAVSEIDVDEKTRLSCENDPAIRLYYASAGERVWEIAKQYRTDVASVLSENELETDTLAGACVLLIPSPQTVQEES